MSLFDDEIMTRFSYSLPDWLMKGLEALKESKGENINSLISQALLKQYPELQKQNNTGPSLISRLIKS